MNIGTAEEFGKALRDRRKALGYTQAYLAEVTGYSASFISELENGKETAELGKALRLAALLGLDVAVNQRD